MSAQTIPWLRRKQEARVAVVGDVILDEYLDGKVSRISPEAPVPVHLVSKTFHGAGGAANAARNIKLAGGEVFLLSVWSDDESSRRLRDILETDQIDTSHIITVTDRPTVRKTRITSNSQQLVRVDWERTHPISEEAQDRILDKLNNLEFDAVLISDYSKGVLPIRLLTNVLELAASRKVPSVVDPKGRDFSKYMHATLITPNLSEACDALGLDSTEDWSGEDLGQRLQKTFGLQNVLVTMGPKGMTLVPKSMQSSEETIELPATARDVYDVSGAGDTVVAIMTLALAAGSDIQTAMRISQTAAALVVEKWGTQPIYLSELESALKSDDRSVVSKSKIVDVQTLSNILKDPKSRNKKVVFTNGCFDILHAGHVSYLENAKRLGDILVVGLNTDESIKKLKGKQRPVVNQANRQAVLAGLSCVDYVVPFAEDTPYNLIAALMPDFLVKGADWEKQNIVGADIVESGGGQIETIELVPGLSTSEIIERIKSL